MNKEIDTPEVETEVETPDVNEEVTEDVKDVDNEEVDDSVKDDDKDDEKIEEKEDPIEYKDFDIPKDLKVNEELLTSFTEKAKGLKLNQEQAQDLLNVYTDAVGKQIKAMSDEFEESQKQWDKDLKDDKDFGGINYETKSKISQNALNKLNKYNIKKTLQEYGLDKHPAIVKTFHLIGKNFIEDGEMIKGGAVKEQERTSGGHPLLHFNMK